MTLIQSKCQKIIHQTFSPTLNFISQVFMEPIDLIFFMSRRIMVQKTDRFWFYGQKSDKNEAGFHVKIPTTLGLTFD